MPDAAALASLSSGRARFTELRAEVADVLAAGHADPSTFAGDEWIKWDK
jgi:hypothetical protein